MTRPLDDRPAPGRLELLRSFVNTRDIDGRREAIATPPEATAWLRSTGLLETDVELTAPDHARVVELREALRSLLVAHATDGEAPAAITLVNATIDRAGLRPRLASADAAGVEVTARGADAALGGLAAIVLAAIAADTWPRLKACPADGCHWAFYDGSKNRSARWCSMRLCGAKAKRETFRRRHDSAESTI